MDSRGRVLVLWNQTEEDIYERWREEGPKPLAWDPDKTAPDVGTVAEEMAGFLQGLRQGGFEVDLVNVEDQIDRVIGAVRLYQPDLVFNLVEYFRDEPVQEGYIAGLYEILGVHYTGNRPMALAICQNKYRTKVLLEAAGLPTAPFFLAKRLPVPADHGLTFPVIVKPALEDASGGIEQASVVHDQAALEARVAYVLKEFEMPALVEEYIDGREIHAAVLGNDPPEILPLFEMVFDDSAFDAEGGWQPRIVTFRAKWDPHSKDFYTIDAVCPALDLSPVLEARIREVASGAFLAMGCRDYARVDMRLSPDGERVYILEVNPNPDLVDGAAYAMCAEASGRSYSQTIGEIAQMALDRRRRARERAQAAKAAEAARAGLPTDALLREWVADQKGVSDAGGGIPSSELELPDEGADAEGVPAEEEATPTAAEGPVSAETAAGPETPAGEGQRGAAEEAPEPTPPERPAPPAAEVPVRGPLRSK